MDKAKQNQLADSICKAIEAPLAKGIASVFQFCENSTEELRKAHEAAMQDLISKHADEVAELKRQLDEAAKGGAVPSAAAAPKAIVNKHSKKFGKDAIRHMEFDDILDVLKERDNAFLAGDAGTGKSQLAEMLADELGIEFYISSQVTQEYKIEGYQDAYGVLHTTPFIEAFTKGGLFVLEEADASSSDVMVILNTALANGYITIPGMGKVMRHKDFCCIATGNTMGTGADDIYVGRQPLDASTLDRFVFFKVEYDERIELKCANGDQELVDFVHDLRKAIKSSGAHIMFPISYRGISTMVKYTHKWGIDKAMKRCIVKGLDEDNITLLHNNMSTLTNKYTRAFRNVARTMRAAA